MELFTIPLADKYIIYRPLRQLAFVGNAAMVELVQRFATAAVADSNKRVEQLVADMPTELVNFLQTVGFLEPDPPPPPVPNYAYQPTTAVLLLTNRCHLRCVYCYANAGHAPAADLTWELAQAVIDQACENALQQVQPHFALSFHGGGEPVLAWSLIKQATAYARTKPLPCRISLTSNGVWSEAQARWIIENLDNVSISIDGAPATQDCQRPFASGVGSSALVLRSLALLDAAQFTYGIRMTALQPWREQLPTDVQFLCEQTGCRAMQVEPAFNITRGGHRAPTQAEAADFVEGFMAAFAIAAQAGRRLTYTGAQPWRLTQQFCSAPYNALIVNPAGRLVSCYEVTDADHPLADLSSVGAVIDAQVRVNQPGREQLLTLIDERRSLCQDCFCQWHCAGDCYVRAFGDTVVHTNFGARCFTNRAITVQMLLWSIMQGDGVWRGERIYG